MGDGDGPSGEVLVSDPGSIEREIKGQEPRGVLPRGMRVGVYEIVAVLGRGAFGITYRARDTTHDRDVAIKEYFPSSLALREQDSTVLPLSTELAEDFVWGRDRFVAEGQTLASLHHAPAVVRMLDFFEANGTAYIVMELLHGETLETFLKRHGPLAPDAIDRILWPLLDGLEQVHNAGFLHRDIKPANILLDKDGSPTLIDFGASRAAMAGRTVAMTAIFTPGYASAEQFTSSRQGPRSDIYSLSATLYHTITGAPPPSAMDRMLDDEYQRLTYLVPAGFESGVLLGIDAGLAVRAADRPQNIAAWRPILGQTGPLDSLATVPVRNKDIATTPAKRRPGLWTAIAVAVVLAMAGGGYYFTVAKQPARVASAPSAEEKAAADARAALEIQREKDQQELARLRAETEARQKADAEAEVKRKADEEVRQKAEAEAAEKKRLEEEDARLKAEQAARQKAAEEAQRLVDVNDKKKAEAVETALRLSVVDRQHMQVALTSLGFNTGGTDGAFGPRSRDIIAGWQKARNQPATGFFTAPQQQALLKEAATVITKYDEEQKKLEEDKKKEEEAKKKADGAKVAAAKGNEQKTIVLNNVSGSNCPKIFSVRARISESKVEMLFGPGLWEIFEVDAGGGFKRSFDNPATKQPMTVSGNLKTRAISLSSDILPRNGCRWAGSF